MMERGRCSSSPARQTRPYRVELTALALALAVEMGCTVTSCVRVIKSKMGNWGIHSVNEPAMLLMRLSIIPTRVRRAMQPDNCCHATTCNGPCDGTSGRCRSPFPPLFALWLIQSTGTG